MPLKTTKTIELFPTALAKQLRFIEELRLQLRIAQLDLIEARGWVQIPNGFWIETLHYRSDLADIGVDLDTAFAITSYRLKLEARPPLPPLPKKSPLRKKSRK